MIRARRATYVSNVKGVGKELNEKLERIVGRAARDGAAVVRASSRPTVGARAMPAETRGSRVSAVVVTPSPQFWSVMLDKGTLSKRKVPLDPQTNRRPSWRVRASRRRKEHRAVRSHQALASGGIEPQYFMIRGQRHAEERLRHYLRNGL